MAAPVVADASVRVDDEERTATTGQMVTGGQACLTCADDDGVDLLGCAVDGHDDSPR